MHHVRADAPPFLILNASQDFAGFVWDARRFAEALRTVGNEAVQQLVFKGADHFTLVKIDDEIIRCAEQFPHSWARKRCRSDWPTRFKQAAAEPTRRIRYCHSGNPPSSCIRIRSMIDTPADASVYFSRPVAAVVPPVLRRHFLPRSMRRRGSGSAQAILSCQRIFTASCGEVGQLRGTISIRTASGSAPQRNGSMTLPRPRRRQAKRSEKHRPLRRDSSGSAV